MKVKAHRPAEAQHSLVAEKKQSLRKEDELLSLSPKLLMMISLTQLFKDSLKFVKTKTHEVFSICLLLKSANHLKEKFI